MMSKYLNIRARLLRGVCAVVMVFSMTVVALVAGAPTPAFARGAVAQRDQDDALKARNKGTLPYGQIKSRAERTFGGRVVGQRLRQVSRDRWVYELRLLRDDGQVISVVMDAHTGEVIGSRGR